MGGTPGDQAEWTVTGEAGDASPAGGAADGLRSLVLSEPPAPTPPDRREAGWDVLFEAMRTHSFFKILNFIFSRDIVSVHFYLSLGR